MVYCILTYIYHTNQPNVGMCSLININQHISTIYTVVDRIFRRFLLLCHGRGSRSLSWLWLPSPQHGRNTPEGSKEANTTQEAREKISPEVWEMTTIEVVMVKLWGILFFRMSTFSFFGKLICGVNMCTVGSFNFQSSTFGNDFRRRFVSLTASRRDLGFSDLISSLRLFYYPPRN